MSDHLEVARTNPRAEPSAAPEAAHGSTMRDAFAHQVIRSFVWQGGGQVVGQVVSWAATMVVIRLLTPADYGLMAMVMVFLSFLFMIADLGISSATVQAKTIRPEQLSGVLGFVITTSILGMVTTLLAAPLVAGFFSEPRLTLVMRVLSINFILMAACSLQQAFIIRDLDFRNKAKIDVASTIAGAAASLAGAALGYGVWALVFGILGQNLVRAVAYVVAFPLRIRPGFSFATIGPLMRFGTMVSIDRIVYFLYGNIDLLIAGRVLGKESLGLYTVALTLAAIPLQKILPTLTQVSFAAFSRIQSDPERVRRNVLRSLRVGGAAAFPALLGLAAVAPSLVPLVLGEKWSEAVIPMQLICLVLPLRALGSILTPALLGTGRPGLNLVNMLVSFVLMALAFAVGVRFGIVGLAMARVVMYPLVFVITTLLTIRVLGLRAGDIAAALTAPVIAAVGMFLIVTLLHRMLPSPVEGWLHLGVLIVTGAAVYLVSLHASDRSLMRDVRATFLT